MAYTDDLEPLLEREQTLRQAIADRITAETGLPPDASTSEAAIRAADEAIATWVEELEAEHDLAAFRPLTPLQTMLAEHHQICERIVDIRDRRLS